MTTSSPTPENQATPISSGGGGMTSSRTLWALGGVLFALFFTAGDVFRGVLADGALPLPGASAEAFARYAIENRTAAVVVGVCQVLSALALFSFTVSVTALVRRITDKRNTPISLTATSGVLSAVFLLVCALLGLLLVAVAPGGNLGLVDGLRQANFLTGGTLHIASLGVLIGATSLAARRAKALPRWLVWLGLVQATIAILSLTSLVFYYANAFILFGRMLGFVWCIAAGLVLVFSGRRQAGARG